MTGHLRRLAAAAALAAIWLSAAGLAAAPGAGAHPLAPALLEVHAGIDGSAQVRWKTPLVRPRGARPEPVWPEGCAPASEPRVSVEGGGRVERFTVRCPFPDWTGRRIGVAGLAATGSPALVRFVFPDGREHVLLLRPDEPDLVLPARSSPAEIARRFASLGVLHLVLGLDHVLFVLGLLLCVEGGRRLAATLTAFTVGHSITLALAVLGWVRVPTAPVEAAIAASILAPAVLAVQGGAAARRGAWRSPWVLALGFGLLHGLGFAGALAEAGLPADAIPLALFAFNVGIEMGQLAWAAVFLAAAAAWRAGAGRERPAALRPALGYGLGCVAGAVLWTRLFAWLGFAGSPLG